jgi:alpha-L-fucosidase 2
MNISWDFDLQEATLWSSNPNCILRLHYREQVATVTVSGGNVYRFNGGLQCVEIYMAP